MFGYVENLAVQELSLVQLAEKIVKENSFHDSII